MPKFLKKFFIIWLPLTFVIVCSGFLSYVLVQQTLRQDANDPQIQIAEDVATILDGGRTPDSLIAGIKINIDKSLSTFLIIYDKDGKQLAESAQFNNKPIDVPIGVLKDIKTGNQNRVTWEPSKGIRSAIVVVKYSGGYVVAGRSMREVEIREDWMMWGTITGVVVMLVGSAIILLGTILGMNLLEAKKLTH
jgi:hypothetical protein